MVTQSITTQNRPTIMTCAADLIGAAPFQYGKFIAADKLEGEKPDAFEKRCWRGRMHVDDKGEIFIPAMALKHALTAAVIWEGEKIKGRGQSTYTKRFNAGIMVAENMPLGIKPEDVRGNWLFVPSDGKKGGSTRVNKCFPTVDKWKTRCEIIVLDPLLMDEINKVYEALCRAGQFVGLGGFRPERGGYFGRFTVENWVVA